MIPILVLTGILTLVTTVLVAVVRLILWMTPRGTRPSLRGLLILTLVALPVHALLTTPALMGLAGSRMVQTRGDERAWSGPRIDPQTGDWLPQTRASLKAEARGEVEVDPAVLAAARGRSVHFDSGDGVALRAFLVPPRAPAGSGGADPALPKATALLVHGLFRGGLEIEVVGAMFRDAGCEVLMLEMRNHGDSGSAPATFGADERLDVLAAVDWLRGRDEAAAKRPLIVYGVSLGGAAVALAAPDIADLAGLALDAPMDTVSATADRMLQARGHGGRRLAFPQPFRSMVLFWLQVWSGFDMASLRPIESVAGLDRSTTVLIVGGGLDDRMPPDVVRSVYDALPQEADAGKQLWIRPESKHGAVFEDDPEGYAERVMWLVDRATG